jgi:hypothetical protein
MLVNGRDCLILIKTQYREMGVPYAEETIREEVSLLREEAAIEGEGICKVIQKIRGVTGCVVTPLTLGTVPLLLSLAMGCAGSPLYVSETRNLYRRQLSPLPVEDSTHFDLVQERGDSRKLYEGCAVSAFELRIVREQAVKLKLDIRGENPPAVYPSTGPLKTETGERFMGDRVSYLINGQEYQNIYGLTLAAGKEGGTKTELWIKRVVNPYPYGFTTSSPDLSQPPSAAADLPDLIEELTLTARLLRDNYERRHYGMFRVTLTRPVLTADETALSCADALIGSLRYYCSGSLTAEVFTAGEGTLE